MSKALIVEDEPKGRANLISMLEMYCPQIDVVAAVGSNAEAKVAINENPDIEVAFLDINLADGQIFSLLQEIGEINFEIIFVTSYERFAVRACNHAAIGYVMKPIDPDDLIAAVKRLRKKGGHTIVQRLADFQNHYQHSANAFEKITVAALDGIYFIKITDITRLEAEDNYSHIFLRNGNKITASKTIKAYEKLLQSVNFFRVHKKHMINLNAIAKYVKGDGGYVVMEDGHKIEVSRRRKSLFQDKMKSLQEKISE